jgi:predicted Zn-dependent peptidase
MAKNQIRGNILLALESSDAQMNRLAKEEYYFGRRIALEEIMATLGNVTESEITEVAENILNQDTFTLVALGPVKQDIDLRGLFLNH